MNTNTDRLPNVFPMRAGEREAVERLVMRSLREYAEHEHARKVWFRDGDGRSVTDGGKGYDFPACIHGMSRWTDYDNICGGCEDGWGYWDYARTLEMYADQVRFARKQWERRAAKVSEFLNGIPRSEETTELRSVLVDWSLEPMTRIL